MNIPTTTQPGGLTAMMAAKYSMDADNFHRVIKTALQINAPNINNEQIAGFLIVCHAYDLNPMLKQIHCYPTKGGGIVPIISIDGWCDLVNRQPSFRGMKFFDHLDADGKVYAVTCELHRSDRDFPTIVTEYMEECFRNTDPWRQSPKRMLRHRSLIQCARYAFGLSGAFDEGAHLEEMEGSPVEIDMEPMQRQVAPPTKRTPPPAPNNGKKEEQPKQGWSEVGKKEEKRPEWTTLEGGKQEAAHDPETGEIFDGEEFLTELDEMLASAKDKDELATIFADFEVQAHLHADKQRLIRAHDLLAWHGDRITKDLKT